MCVLVERETKQTRFIIFPSLSHTAVSLLFKGVTLVIIRWASGVRQSTIGWDSWVIFVHKLAG